MSSFAADIGIWVLLAVGVLFSGIGLMGLVIFPDTRSRMFTAFRATAIGLGAVAAAVLTYGCAMLVETGAGEYPALIIHTLVFTVILAACMRVMHRMIREKTGNDRPGSSPDGAGTGADNDD